MGVFSVLRRYARRPVAKAPLFVLVLCLAAVTVAPPVPSSAEGQARPVAAGTGGAVATVQLEASEAGLEVLRRGGNAVDAAVAAAAVLGVTEPFSAGIGGGGFMVIYTAADASVTTIDHREVAPAAMAPDSFFEDGKALGFNEARFSGLSAGVPGTVQGWSDALARYGTISLAEALRPAIRVARNGFVVDRVFSEQVAANTAYFDDISSTRRLYLEADGTPPDIGTTFRNPDLARTYERIAHLGPKGFYRGVVAAAMVRAVAAPPTTPDADHRWRPGVMTMRDVKGYVAPERAPTRVSYRGLDVYGMGPPSSGGSTVGEALNILEGFDLAGMKREQALHYFLEASRLSFADRNAYLADPGFFAVPLSGLLSQGYANERASLVGERAAPGPVAAGDPYPYNGGGSASVASSAGSGDRGNSTTHLTVADRWGNVVSYTYTIESVGGNGIVVPGWGFLLNNELTDFNFDSLTHPNRVEGGKRPRSSMSPTIVLDSAGHPVVALGSPGGSTIITTVLQMLVNHIDFGMSLPDALEAPRLSQRNTATTLAEPEFLATAEATALAARGHRFSPIGEIGAATGIEFLGDGSVRAVAESRRRGGGSAVAENRAGP